uniref:Uncharacterized protein n=1 Tax=Rhizophora mucronata TaxID=61149 RepID=A0A2P2L6W8_RHIMU
MWKYVTWLILSALRRRELRDGREWGHKPN